MSCVPVFFVVALNLAIECSEDSFESEIFASEVAKISIFWQ